MDASQKKSSSGGLFSSLRVRGDWKKIPFKIRDDETIVRVCTEMLALLDDNSKDPDKRAVHTVRGDSLAALKRYDESIDDHALAVEFCRRKKTASNTFEAGESEKRMRRVRSQRIFDSLEPNSLKAVRWTSMPDPTRMQDWKYYTQENLNQLLTYLGDPDPDIRARADDLAGILPYASHRDMLDWLIAFYRQRLGADDRQTAWRALRQLGRTIFMLPGEEVPAEVSLVKWGVAAAFTSCGCPCCGFINTAIPLPPKGPFIPWYAQKEVAGAYTLPVICDRCGREFHLCWDSSPE